jgi:hypothetical protein
MSEKKEIKPRLFKVTAGTRYYDKYFVIAYTANDALQMVMDQYKRAKDYALNIKSVECLNFHTDGMEEESAIMILPECIRGGLQNRKE